jgi:hypothetical protein
MEPICTAPSPADATARLSFAQKRDLLGQAVAAIVTTALIAAPLMSPTPESTGGAPSVLQAQSFAAPVTAVAVADVTGRLAFRDLSQSGRPLRVRDAGAAPRATREPSRKPMTRRLTGWLTGDGTHPVRPFPSIPASRP